MRKRFFSIIVCVVLCNAKFAEKGLDVRIDHRSYERQGVELLPTVHEGATVRACLLYTSRCV